MDIKIMPSALSGKIDAISSKSDAHRILVASALSKSHTEIKLGTTSRDIEATVLALSAMGTEFERCDGKIKVIPRPFKDKITVNAEESGSTLRFLIPIASAVSEEVTFKGKGRLPERPIGALLRCLEENGVSFSSSTLPFTKRGRLTAGEYKIRGDESSQYITGLLFALSLIEGESKIILTTKLESSGYVDMTLAVLEKFGVKVKKTDFGFLVKGQEYISPVTVSVEGDWSNSAFFLVSGAVESSVSVSGLDLNSPQGDKKIIEIIRSFGGSVSTDGKITTRESALRATDIDVSEIPDMLPSLAVLSSFAKGKTKFLSGKRLRMKESDRLRSTSEMINSLGGKAIELDDGIIIEGVGLRGGEVFAFNDHRIVMAAAVALALSKEGGIIRGAEAVEKSYPSFFKDFEKLGGKYCVI